MGINLSLSAEQACSARAIQAAIDGIADVGGRVVLPEMDLTLDRGIALRSGVELIGQGAGTVLHKGPGRVYPLAGYHNYGMCDAPLEDTSGLDVGMTVCLRSDTRGGFYETFARITWIDGNWVGLSRGLDSDYAAGDRPVLVTAYPLVYGLGVRDVALRDLVLDGARDTQEAGIGACRGAAVYFYQSDGFEVTNVSERGFMGEGLGFQMCSHGLIRGCQFDANAGNGFHPGAGSTAALFEDCIALDNESNGFFFCVRANHITVRGCEFGRNRVAGISIGTRDCYNRITDCRFVGNDGPGIDFRGAPRPIEVHSVEISGCSFTGNGAVHGRGSIDVVSDAHDLIIADNTIDGLGGKPAVYVAPSATRVFLADNVIAGRAPEVIAPSGALLDTRPEIEAGYESARPEHFRHLP